MFSSDTQSKNRKSVVPEKEAESRDVVLVLRRQSAGLALSGRINTRSLAKVKQNVNILNFPHPAGRISLSGFTGMHCKVHAQFDSLILTLTHYRTSLFLSQWHIFWSFLYVKWSSSIRRVASLSVHLVLRECVVDVGAGGVFVPHFSRLWTVIRGEQVRELWPPPCVVLELGWKAESRINDATQQ